MKDRRKNRKKRKLLLILYLLVCLTMVVAAYFHLRRIAREYNTQHLELITSLYAEKMNESMEYLQSFAEEDVKLIQDMDDKAPENILKDLESNLNSMIFCNVGLILQGDEILGSECTVSDIRKKKLDEQALGADTSFISDPYQSSETGSMVMTIFVPVKNSGQIRSLYMSVMIEDLRQLGVYDLLQGKVSVQLLKTDSENYITCMGDDAAMEGNWNNLLLQQKYFHYDKDYSYHQWIRDMRSGVKEGRFSAEIRGEESTISYRSISSMPGWYVIVELANKNISDIAHSFSVWGGIYGGILVGFTVLYMLTIVFLEKKDKKHYMGLSTIDDLTQILNRRAFQVEVEEELRRKKKGYLIFIDVDNFKTYNDRYGHGNGDFCLKHFARTMQACFPKGSIIGRYGGDEFVVYLKRMTVEEVYACMDTFQKQVADLKLPTGEDVQMSASAGGAVFPEQGEDVLTLCRSADIALYDVKRNGKASFKMKELS